MLMRRTEAWCLQLTVAWLRGHMKGENAKLYSMEAVLSGIHAHTLCCARRWHPGCGSKLGSRVQSPKCTQTALSQRLPISSTVASPKEIKLLKYTFGLYFVKYPGTRQKVEHLTVFRKRQTYFKSGFVFWKQLFPQQWWCKITSCNKLPE